MQALGYHIVEFETELPYRKSANNHPMFPKHSNLTRTKNEEIHDIANLHKFNSKYFNGIILCYLQL